MSFVIFLWTDFILCNVAGGVYLQLWVEYALQCALVSLTLAAVQLPLCTSRGTWNVGHWKQFQDHASTLLVYPPTGVLDRGKIGNPLEPCTMVTFFCMHKDWWFCYCYDHMLPGSIDGGIGVENLQGSGSIAGETSRAYNEAGCWLVLIDGASCSKPNSQSQAWCWRSITMIHNWYTPIHSPNN